MYSLTYTITTLAPVLLPSNLGELNTVGTRQCMNGGSLLGAFAWKYLRQHTLPEPARQDTTFSRWFLSGDLRFTNAYIVDSDTRQPHFPAPMSFHQGKHAELINGNAVADLLFEDTGYLLEEAIQTKPVGNFVHIEHGDIHTQQVGTSLNFHHQRQRDRGITQEIFTYESLDAGQVFAGAILGEREVLQPFLEFLRQEDSTCYVGRSKNAQYGKVRIDITSSEPDAFYSEVAACNTPDMVDSQECALTLLSDTIVVNRYGAGTTDITSLERALQAVVPGLALDWGKSFVKTGLIESFVSVWGLSTPADVCFLAGSVLWITVPDTSRDALRTLQQQGLGERCHEGFGRLVAGWQHDEFQGYQALQVPSTSLQQPAGSPPDGARTIARGAIDGYLKQAVRLAAIEQAKSFLQNFGRRPSKSLLAKLESMALAAPQEQAFIDHMGALRETAKRQLERCRNPKKTLWEFLTNHTISVDPLTQQDGGKMYRKLAQELGYAPEENTELMLELFRLSLRTMLGFMRKETATQEGGKGR